MPIIKKSNPSMYFRNNILTAPSVIKYTVIAVVEICFGKNRIIMSKRSWMCKWTCECVNRFTNLKETAWLLTPSFGHRKDTSEPNVANGIYDTLTSARSTTRLSSIPSLRLHGICSTSSIGTARRISIGPANTLNLCSAVQSLWGNQDSKAYALLGHGASSWLSSL